VAPKPVDAKKLVGKWKLVKGTDQTLPEGAVIEFTANGKYKTLGGPGGGKGGQGDGEYKLEGNKLSVTTRPIGKDSVAVYVILDLDDLTLKRQLQIGDVEEFKRQK
jgi:uncharacterized protein (TIGR03066 family)